MRILNYLKLFWMIYGKNDFPDLKKIQSYGLLAVKISQMYALRSDFLNTEKCKHLSKLYRLNPKVEFEKIKVRFEQNAKPELLSQIKDFVEEPIATASVGQVHKATLKSGETVAIKIIKEDFKEDFLKDAKTLEILFKTAIFFYPKLARVADPIGTLNTVKKTTLAELNLNKEIEGQEILKELKKSFDDPDDLFALDKLKFPKIYQNLSNEKVLVTEFLDLPTFDELLAKGKLSYAEVLTLFKLHGAMLFMRSKFHGDLHPGNIFLDSDKNLYFIDISTIEEVEKNLSDKLLVFFRNLAKYDYSGCAKALQDASVLKLNDQDFQKFEKKLHKLYDDFKGKTVAEKSLTIKMLNTIKLAVKSGMEFPKGMFAIVKSLMYLDGMILKASPDTILSEMIGDIDHYSEQFLK